MRGKDTFCFKKKRKPESFAPLANSRNLHSYHEEMKFLKKPMVVPQISSDSSDDRMGAKIKTRKNTRASNKTQNTAGLKFNPPKILCRIPVPQKFIRATVTRPRYVGTITNLQIALNARKNLYLNQATPKNTCQNFPTPKNFETENFKPKKILRLSLSLEIRSTPPGFESV